MDRIFPIPALRDNYIWCLVKDNHCVIVDPGEAKPVFETLATHNLSLIGILITHYHWDHCNGLEEILSQFDVPVFCSEIQPVNGTTTLLNDGDIINLPKMDLSLTVLGIPGHTLGHLAFLGDEYVFTGDTLFTCGCGKVFEGTTEQMYNSLSRLASLQKQTLIYCGHEYTVSNCEFARLVEPNNEKLHQRLIEAKQEQQLGKPTVPSILSLELETNPFLRCEQASVISAATKHADKALNTPADVFAEIRHWKG